MSKNVINLTHLVVLEEIDNYLANCSEKYFQNLALSPQSLRSKLTVFVLRKIPQQYTVIENSEQKSTSNNFQGCLLEERSQIKDLIEKGKNQILPNPENSVSSQFSKQENLVTEPSSWFG